MMESGEKSDAYFPASSCGRRSMTARGYGTLVDVVGGGGGEAVPAPAHPVPGRAGMDVFGLVDDGGGAQGRWPREETLTLLEIRTRLDSKFREVSQKSTLWDEVSRIMAKEHGYQRSGKKCREKLENLYKYYKKTKGGKAGRHDGKHYRFFRQLEALYGENININPATSNQYCSHVNTAIDDHWLVFGSTLVFSDSTDQFGTTSSDDDEEVADDGVDPSTIVRGFVETQMRRVIELQEAWLDKMLTTVERMERDRVSREDAWREQEVAKWNREHRLWASERAWIEARDTALIEALQRISGTRSSEARSKVEFVASMKSGEDTNPYYDDHLQLLYDEGDDNEGPQAFENIGVR